MDGVDQCKKEELSDFFSHKAARERFSSNIHAPILIMFKVITTLASIVLFTAAACEGRRLFRIDSGDNQFSAEHNSVNSFESLLHEEDGRNVFRFLANNFASSMSFSMSMNYRIDPSPTVAVPKAPTPAPAIPESSPGTPLSSHAPPIFTTTSPSKNPTDNPSEQPTLSIKPTSTEESQLQLDAPESMNHRTTLIGSLLAVGLVAMALFIHRAQRRGRFSIVSTQLHTDASTLASK
jgi:hypothetical protein